jgi:uncharacterized protein
MDSTMTPNVKIISDLYDASARGDLAAVTRNISPDVVWNVAENHPYAPGNPYLGLEAVIEKLLSNTATLLPDVATAVDELLDAGDKVVAQGRYKGLCKSTGKMLNAQMVHIWTLRDGKVVQFQQHVDTLQLYNVLRAD